MNFRPTALALLVVLALPAPAPAPAAASTADIDTLAFLGQRVSVASSGDAVLAETIVLAAAGPGRVSLPFGFERADSFTVRGRDAAFPLAPGGGRAPLRAMPGRRLLVLELGPAAAAGETVVVHCRLPKFADWAGARGEFGAYTLAKTFVNDSDVSLGAFQLALEVPPGFQVRRITLTEPAFKPETSPVPPYAVGAAHGRGYASVSAKQVRPGGRARIAIQAERVSRGSVPLAAGLLLALLYLWFFRDLLAPRRSAGTPVQRPTGSK